MDMRAFLTGSRVYGRPRAASDIDLVVYVTEADMVLLRNMSEPIPTGTTNTGSEPDRPFDEVGCPLRFGKLNLLCVTNELAYEVWKKGTRQLKVMARTKPVTREEAVALFRKLREEAGLTVKRRKEVEDVGHRS